MVRMHPWGFVGTFVKYLQKLNFAADTYSTRNRKNIWSRQPTKKIRVKVGLQFELSTCLKSIILYK